MTSELIEVKNLGIQDIQGNVIFSECSFTASAGTCTALMGPSGCGKTTLLLALVGMVRSGLRIHVGEVQVRGRSVTDLSRRDLRQYRRRQVAFLAQDPALSLVPHHTTRQIFHSIAPELRGDEDIIGMLGTVGLSDVPGILDRLPKELSGGQRRRIALSASIARGAHLLLLDEPTAGLDREAREDVLRVVRDLQRSHGVCVILSTHDPDVASVADTTLVFGEKTVALAKMATPEPSEGSARPPTRDPNSRTLLEARGFCVSTPDGKAVVDGQTGAICEGETVIVTGPSGSGKTTLIRCLLGLHPYGGQLALTTTDGTVEVLPQTLGSRSVAQVRAIQAIPQDPLGSLNPALTVGRQLRRALRRVGVPQEQRQERLEQLLEAVSLDRQLASRLPSQLSGGQAARVAIARALAMEPRIIIADEATAALDSDTETAVLSLFRGLQQAQRFGLIVVTHSQHVIAQMPARIVTLGKEKHHGHSNKTRAHITV